MFNQAKIWNKVSEKNKFKQCNTNYDPASPEKSPWNVNLTNNLTNNKKSSDDQTIKSTSKSSKSSEQKETLFDKLNKSINGKDNKQKSDNISNTSNTRKKSKEKKWKSVHQKKRRNNPAKFNNSNTSANKSVGYGSHQNWDTVILKKKPKVNYQNNKSNNKSNNKNKNKNVSIDPEEGIVKVNNIDINTSNKIKNARSNLKISQKDLASKCNLKVSIIKDYENGNCPAERRILSKIGRALNINL